jgi:hypothetical protein
MRGARTRSPDTCPHRLPPTGASDDGRATCAVVRRLTGAVDPVVSQVDLHTCTHCCDGVEPDESHLNYFFASHLYRLVLSLGARGGVEGCDADQLMRLQEFAGSQLEVVEVKNPDPFVYVPDHTRPCFHLGEPLANGDGPPADGRPDAGPDPWHRCRHELIQRTTLRGCRTCRYYDPQLQVGRAVQLWSVGVLTAPRAEPTLERTLRSLAKAGWDEVRLFAEPGAAIPRGFPERRVTRRSERVHAWPNFLLALMELLLRQPHADAYLLCEDDVLFCGGLRAYLEETLWPAERLGVVSLFTSGYRDPGNGAGFFPTRHGLATWGAQAFLFPNAAARAMIRHADIVNHRSRGPRQGKADTDAMVGWWCQRAGLDCHLHSPSLGQHIGETSALWETSELAGLRVASTFPGEDCDIAQLMAKASR